jgi:hypothetical protein
MSVTHLWHSIKSEVYHNNIKCKTGNNIEEENRILGDGGKRLCQECERLASKKRVGINKNLFLSDLSNK